MRKYLGGLVALIILAAIASPVLAKSERVLVCHAAGRAGTTHFVTLSVPPNSGGFPQGHFTEGGSTAAGHEDDYLGPCLPEVTPSATPSSTPVATSTPSVEPTPTLRPSSPPSPTPSSTITPTPGPSTAPTPTPVVAPIPTTEPSSTPTTGPTFTSPPSITPPPTDTEPASGSSAILMFLGGFFLVIGLSSYLKARQRL